MRETSMYQKPKIVHVCRVSLLSAGMATYCGRQNNSPKDVHILIHRACDCITLHGRREFVDVVKLRTLRWGDFTLDHLSGPSLLTSVFIRERQEGQIQRIM